MTFSTSVFRDGRSIYCPRIKKQSNERIQLRNFIEENRRKPKKKLKKTETRDKNPGRRESKK